MRDADGTDVHVPWAGAKSFEFGGVRLIDIDIDSAVASIVRAARTGQPHGLHLCNAYTLSYALRSPTYQAALRHPHAVNLPDGTPVSWFYRLSSRRSARGPVRGPSLMKAVLAQPGLRHYLLGGSPQTLADLQQVISLRYPDAVIAGSLAPPFSEPSAQDVDDYAKRIADCGAEVVWVGLGTPRQDVVIAELVGRADAVYIGVGAAFDFLSGHKAEAPAFLHHTGLEWAYRLACEPGRLWRRYLIGNTVFLAQGALEYRSSRRAAIAEAISITTRRAAGAAVRTASGSVGSRATERFPRVPVGAASVHCIDQESALDVLVDAARSDEHRWLVVTPNIQHIALLEVDRGLRAAYARADLVLADGWPVVRAVRLLAGVRMQRVTGADLLPALCERAAAKGLRVGIVGGLHGAAEEAAARLSERFPRLTMAAVVQPTLGFESDRAQVADVVAQVSNARLDILFLALGAPKQEKFAAAHLEAMGASVTVCVGAAVDFVAGRQRRAPHLLRNLGLEWAYRAVREPRRLVPRYARSAPVFAQAVLRSSREHRARTKRCP